MNPELKPDAVRIDHLNMTVRNLAESESWYRKVFGFERVEGGTRNGEAWAIVRQGDVMLCLYEQKKAVALNETEDSWHTGPLKIWHFGLRITDREAWERTIEREKLEIEYGEAIRYPHSWSWYVTDPSGHEIEVALWDGDEVKFGESGRSLA